MEREVWVLKHLSKANDSEKAIKEGRILGFDEFKKELKSLVIQIIITKPAIPFHGNDLLCSNFNFWKVALPSLLSLILPLKSLIHSIFI